MRPRVVHPLVPCVVAAVAVSCILVSCARHRGAAPRPVTAPPTFTATSQPTTFECRWTDEPITIDGKADEPAWQHAQVIDHFEIPWLQGDARTPKVATKAKLLWDREYLYFYAEMEDRDLYAKVKEHQGRVWTDDAFELFFKPADDRPGYYEFEVNPLDATLELFIPIRDTGGYDRYKNDTNIEMKTVVVLHGSLNNHDDQDQGWQVEGRIRWRDFSPTGGRPNVGETWKMNLCRVNLDTGGKNQELSTCVPLTRPDYHHFEDYAPVTFVGPDGSTTHRPYGIERRTLWTTSRVVGSPDPPMPYTVANAFPNLKVFQPLYVLAEPGTGDYLLLQHLGNWAGPSRLLRMHNDPSVSSTETLLDMDRLVYGMTLHPDFLHNGYIYFLGNGPVNSQHRQNRISRFMVERNPPYHIDPKSELVILEWDSAGHDGGDLAFGPDGFLYHAAGDGSSDSDANLRGQDLTHLNSAMLRIDVDHPDHDKPYSIPKDNPFLGVPGARPEIWAYGFRNPWRITFDRKSGALWVGQNGQDTWEQVYRVEKGANYGWSVFEGSHPFNLNRQRGPTPISFPTIEHPHSEMRSITGGIVYWGEKFPQLQGAYLYGDFSTGRIWGVKHDGTKVTWHQELARTTLQITGFREAADGEILVIDHGGGIYKLIPQPNDRPAVAFPTKLSETGLFDSTEENVPEPGLIPYSVNSPLWSDGSIKERFMAVPGDGTIDVTPARGWNFPEGTVLVKTFSLELEPGNASSRRRVETRLLTKQLGQWVGYSYAWNDQQTDATLVAAAGADKAFTIRDAGDTHTQTWHYPSRSDCMVCHTRASNFVLGPSTLQLNKVHDYGTVRDNQLRTLEHLGVLRVDYPAHAHDAARREMLEKGMTDQQADQAMAGPPNAPPQREPKPSTLLAFNPDHTPALPDPYDPKQDLSLRARSYLHANCAICHVESGGGNALMNLEYGVPLEKMRIVDVVPQHETFGIPNARLIASGGAQSSVLYYRLAHRGQGQMPPLATSRSDERALELMRQWILKLPPSSSPSPSGRGKG